MQELSAPLADVARAVARRIAEGSRARAWIVGGAVRDLALGRPAHDVDMASAAHPDAIERLFPRTIALGRAYGTVILVLDGLEVQHTTFRSERGYADARRPDAVEFGTSVEEDATRRDFTANALYLDPLDGEVRDPCGGLQDLAQRRLRCVGDARARFEEDGLRLIRLARFAAALELDVEPPTLEAARASGAALRGVSPERVLGELERIFGRAHAARALGILAGGELLERALPGFETDARERWDARRVALESLEAWHGPPGLDLGLALLYGPDPRAIETFESLREVELDALERLRISRATRNTIVELWRLAAALAAAERPPESRATRVRWMRSATFDAALALARAWRTSAGADGAALDALAVERRTLAPDDLRPAAWITSADLQAAGIARGPAWGALLTDAETLQLDRAWRDEREAREWLARRARELAHDGGNTRRSANDKG